MRDVETKAMKEDYNDLAAVFSYQPFPAGQMPKELKNAAERVRLIAWTSVTLAIGKLVMTSRKPLKWLALLPDWECIGS